MNDIVNSKEKKIDIKEVIVWIFYRWKMALVIAFVTGASIFLYEYVSAVRSVPEKIEEGPYVISLEEYDNHIRLLEEKIRGNYEYVHHSLLMQIDAGRVQVKSIQYKLDNPLVCEQLIHRHGTVCKEITENLDYVDEVQYIEEILEISKIGADGDASGFELVIKGKDEQTCERIAAEAEKAVDEVLQSMGNTYGEFQYTVDNRETYAIADADLCVKQMQQLSYIQPSYITTLTDAIQQLEIKKNQLAEGGTAAKNEIGYITIVKFLILSAVGGVLFAGVFLCILYLLNNKVKTTGEVENLYHLNILGILKGEKKRNDNENVYECIKYDLVHEAQKCSRKIKFLIVGMRKEPEIGLKFINDGLDTVDVEYMNRLEYGVETFKKIDEADEIILYIALAKDSYTQIEKIIEMMQRRDAHIFGAIVRKDR